MVQPGDGVTPTVKAINSAKQRVEIVIFRFDRAEIEKALANAVDRGVFVHALIAYTNRGGEKNLRKLEMRLLAAGVTVARTADDLTRYHGKMMIIDRRELYLLAFNFTSSDIDHSRSFGLVTGNKKLVRRLSSCSKPTPSVSLTQPGMPNFVVSPVNARKQLSGFLKGAKKQLLIYDPEVSDPGMIRILEERAKAGVEVQIIGRLTRKSAKLEVDKLCPMRLHTRTIIRDGTQALSAARACVSWNSNARRESRQ